MRLRQSVRWAAVGCLTAIAAACCRADVPTRQDLGGAWQLKAQGKPDAIDATVPGCVHTDLLAAGVIGDPFFGDRAASLRWIGDTEWTYGRTFTPSADLLRRRHVVLRCEGLDTVARVTLNGHEVGRADNTFRAWTFDVGPWLRPGENRVEVVFTPVKQYAAAFVKAAQGTGPNTAYDGLSNVRTALYAHGWDFAPAMPTAGIYRPIELIGYDVVRLDGLLVDADAAAVTVRANLSNDPPPGTRLRAAVTLDDKPVAVTTGDAGRPLTVRVPDPKLWWPNGMGDRPLYHVCLELLDAGGAVLDTADRRFGLRRIELLRPADGKPLRLRVNGRDLFCRGANWVPADMFLPRVTPGRVRNLLGQAAAANMNMVRVWGGGADEDDAFYDACDELGLLVWNDFKFACRAYPGRNAGFAENVREEVRQQVTRLSTHPSLAVWCGNNEVEAIVRRYGLMSRSDYDLLFHDLIGNGLRTLLPNANYVTGSPDEGDEHNWWVWHIGAEFEKYRDSHGWMTEFGFESFPSPATIESFTTPDDRASVLSPVMKAHQHNGNGRGNEMILDQMARYFRPAKDFESTLWLSQINQAYGLRMGVEHWRADWPKSSGAFVWQLNDCQPGPTWSMIDYFGRPKAAMFAVRDAYASVMVTGVYDKDQHTLPLTICSEGTAAFRAEVRWDAFDAAGRTLANGTAAADVPAGVAAVSGPTLRLGDAVARGGRENLIVRVDVLRDGRPVATNTLLAARPKEVPLMNPEFAVDVVDAGNGFDVTVSCRRPALFAWLTLPGDPDARYSDNFIHTTPGRAVRIRVTPSRPIGLEPFRRQLEVRSLFDTYPPTSVAPSRTGE